jgi:hypothetical protein
VDNHDGSQGQTHEEQGQWLQTIEVAQEILRGISIDRLPQGRARDERRTNIIQRTIARETKFW